MQTKTLKSEFLLLVAALIWGTTFVAQRQAVEHIGPFVFNACRFGLGGLVLLPWLWRTRQIGPERTETNPLNSPLIGGILVGVFLFAGATFQQKGLVSTTAGKGGFITGMYVVLVPLMGLLWGHRITAGIGAGTVLAVIGLYFLSITENVTIEKGDLLVLIGTFFWAIHVLVVGHYARRANPMFIAAMQCFVCSSLSLCAAVRYEPIDAATILAAGGPILYAGVFSAAVAFSIQVFGQRTCPPAPASIIMSMETVFAALAGWIVLGERLSSRNLLGCALMLAGMLIVQLAPLRKRSQAGRPSN
jgi:drug/metabolite transporter (DMT)-like permease